MTYEWDAAKAAANARKHHVSFAEAASVFLDPAALTFADPDHSTEEERWIDDLVRTWQAQPRDLGAALERRAIEQRVALRRRLAGRR